MACREAACLKLTPTGLNALTHHKYVPGTYTPLDNWMNPAWFYLCELLPVWLAPNAVTLLGFVPMAFSYVITWLASPTCSEPVPAWVALFSGLSVLFYQTLDALDGKQARRTGTASPVGQLFDHGFDALACLCHHSVVAAVFLVGPGKLTVFSLSLFQSAFFTAQWMEQHTGVLQTACGPFGVTETQFGAAGLAFVAAALGPKGVQNFFAETPAGVIGVLAWLLLLTVLISIVVPGVLRAVMRKTGSAGVAHAIGQLLPVIMVNVAACFLWSDETYVYSVRKITLLTGLILFFYTIQMITSTMAEMQFPPWQLETLIPYVAIAVMSRFLAVELTDMLLSVSILLFAAYLARWITHVLNQATEQLGIQLFRITSNDKSN